ncbi:phosphopantetheine-binding protein [Sphaerisporangium sp. B11E5]|uniref:phosphopantetheine-binding protein n=1 Tax=Sphaerisporangium sp. B11E5 TaxID=3153563 RepID=UPI00325E4ED1
MDRLSDSELTVKIKDAIIRVLDLDLDHERLTDDISLYSSVVRMDSLTLLQLLVTLEREFNVEIDDEDVMNANLDNVGSLIAMIRQAVTGGGVASESGRTA